MMHSFVRTVTNLGDAVFLSAVAIMWTLDLWRLNHCKKAFSLLAALVLGVISITAAKIIALKFGSFFEPLNIRSPSGHAANSTAFYATAAMIMTSRVHPIAKILIWLFAVILIASIAVSRILLGAHTPQEVVAGLIIGFSMFFLINQTMLRHGPLLIWKARNILLIFFVAAMFLLGSHVNAEAQIDRFAGFL